MTDDAQARFARLEALKHEVAKACKLSPSHERVAIVAAMKLQHELVVERMVASGDPGDADKLTALSKAISEMLPPIPPEPITVELEFVGGVFNSCPECGWKHPRLTLDEVRALPPDPPETSPAPTTINLSAEEIIEKPAPKALPAPNSKTFHGKGDTPPRENAPPAYSNTGETNPFLGGFSASKDSLGMPRWPNPNRGY